MAHPIMYYNEDVYETNSSS